MKSNFKRNARVTLPLLIILCSQLQEKCCFLRVTRWANRINYTRARITKQKERGENKIENNTTDSQIVATQNRWQTINSTLLISLPAWV